MEMTRLRVTPKKNSTVLGTDPVRSREFFVATRGILVCRVEKGSRVVGEGKRHATTMIFSSSEPGTPLVARIVSTTLPGGGRR